MEENRNMNNNNSSENEVVEVTQQPEGLKDEIKNTWKEVNDEWDKDPDIPKSKFGRVAYGLLGFVLIIGIGAAVWHFGRQAVYTVASQFVFLKPSDEEILDAATQEAEKLIEEKDLPWACELDPDSVEVNYLGELKKSCEGSSEEPSKHYEYSVKFVYNVDLPDGDDREPTIQFDDFKISYGEGHYSVIKPELIVFPDKSYNSDYISKEELGDALDELGNIFDNMVNDDEEFSGNSGSSSNDYSSDSYSDSDNSTDDYSGEQVDENIPYYYTDEDLITWAKTYYEDAYRDAGSDAVLRFPDDGRCLYMGVNACGDTDEYLDEFDGCTKSKHGWYMVTFEVFDEMYPDDLIGVQMHVVICDQFCHVIAHQLYDMNVKEDREAFEDYFELEYIDYKEYDDARLEYLSSGY